MAFRHLCACCLAIACLTQCRPETEPNTLPTDKKRNEQAAGDYAGQFACASYGGPAAGWTLSESSGTLSLLAVGSDSLRLAVSAGCLYDTYRFGWDSLQSAGKPYLYWRGNAPYAELRSWGDSVMVSVPRPSGYGWLTSTFRGQKK
ncbi:MAG TPA: hypothetical protein PK971_09025 [Saprospiraceae bacterium]|nr:hypothetical protein [Saprospiraceae bacterium]